MIHRKLHRGGDGPIIQEAMWLIKEVQEHRAMMKEWNSLHEGLWVYYEDQVVLVYPIPPCLPAV